MPRQPLDWTKTGTLAAMADWLMKDGDCICVLAIRGHDSVFSVDPECSPSEAERLVKEYVVWLAGRVEHTRKEKKQAVRLVYAGGDQAELQLTPDELNRQRG